MVYVAIIGMNSNVDIKPEISVFINQDLKNWAITYCGRIKIATVW